MTPVVEAHGIAKLFGSLVAVDDLTITVEAGDVLGILGPERRRARRPRCAC